MQEEEDLIIIQKILTKMWRNFGKEEGFKEWNKNPNNLWFLNIFKISLFFKFSYFRYNFMIILKYKI